MLFYVASAAKDLGEAIALFARYFRIVNDAVRIKLTRGDNDLVVETSPRRRFEVSGGAERGVWNCGCEEFLREITGRNVHPTKITFIHMRNPDFLDFERSCGCPVEFGGVLLIDSSSPIKASPCPSLRMT